MVEVRTYGPPELPDKQDGVKDGTVQNNIFNRRIEHTITAAVVNNRFPTKYTLDIRPEKQDSVINFPKVHRSIVDIFKLMDVTAEIITQDNLRITNNNTIPNDKGYTNLFPDQRLCKVTKRMYISFTLESDYTLSQLKHRS